MKYPLFLGDQFTSVQSMIWQSYVNLLTCTPVIIDQSRQAERLVIDTM